MKTPRVSGIGCARRSSTGGAALIIILAFMALLLGLLLAFFSKSTLQQQVSQASSNLTSGDILARGAVESIVGDLLQEITAGSIVTNIVTGSVTNTLYYPATNSNMVPSLSGFTTNAGLENILKVSGTNSVFSVVTSSGSTSNGPIRGSASASTNTSYNGRSVSTARWNRSLLIGRQNPTSTTDYTPTNAFNNAIPQWILIARNGSNPTTWSTNMRWSPTNGTTVIGRYAYIIHNEGGLLDANVAGYPPALTNSTVTNPAYVPYKAGTFFADLTQIGLTTNQITALVGWRNNASAQASGNYPSYTIPNNGTNYGAAMMADTNGILITYQTNSISDRRFTSRQQLIEFLKAADTSGVTNALNALPYLGTFSRSLDQPTYFWDSNRPKIFAIGITNIYGNATNTPLYDYAYQNWGGNSAYSYDDLVNPSFPTNRVATTFTRYDRPDQPTNGTPAVVGEPLVKKRFPLSRLAWLTCKGPSASVYSANANDPVILQYLSNGISLQTITNGTTTNIYKSFGLTWTGPSGSSTDYNIGGYWTYSHGIANTVGTLSAVAALTGNNAREPDFFELLKAGLYAGSLAKGPGINKGYPALDQGGLGNRDTTLDFHVLQIGVNILAQATPAGFPPLIKFYDGSWTYPFWGVCDLPYLQGITEVNILVRQANPAPSDLGSNPALPVTNSTNPLTDGGQVAILAVPIVWNPHAAPVNTLPSGLQPSNLRIWISNLDMAWPNRVLSTPGNFYVSYYKAAYVVDGNPTSTNPANSVNTNAIYIPWQTGGFSSNNGLILTNSGSSSNTAMTFSYGTNLYREPTPLMRPGLPSGSSLALDTANNVMIPDFPSGSITELGSGTNFIGFYAGSIPSRWAVTNTISAGVTNTNVYTAMMTAPNGAFGFGYTFTVSLDYQVQSGGPWIPYRQYMIPLPGNPPVPYGTNTGASFLNYKASVLDTNLWKNYPANTTYPVALVANIQWDPRTSRWASAQAYGPGNFLDSSKTSIQSQRSGAGTGFTMGTGSQAVPYGNISINGGVGINPGTGNLSGGIFPSSQPGTAGNALQYYFINTNGYAVDADGVARLGMGAAYSSGVSTTNGLPLVTPAAPSSRPIMLNRPFRNVGELGYVFSDTPWRNIDFATPQSGCSALLDIFCIQENNRPDAVVAGKVDLNTRQTPVIRALIAGGCRDELAQQTGSDTNLNASIGTEGAVLATNLIARTTGSATNNLPNGPLRNIGDLVGRWISGLASTSGGQQGQGMPTASNPVYDGFSANLASYYTNSSTSVTNRVQRFIGAPIRALANTGQVGAWNLLIDVVVQTGKYPVSAGNIDQFQVQGETRYWVHLAIDRLTGKVLEKSIERVNE